MGKVFILILNIIILNTFGSTIQKNILLPDFLTQEFVKLYEKKDKLVYF